MAVEGGTRAARERVVHHPPWWTELEILAQRLHNADTRLRVARTQPTKLDHADSTAMFLFISSNHPYASALSTAFFLFSFLGLSTPNLPQQIVRYLPEVGRVPVAVGPLMVDPLHALLPTLCVLVYSMYALLRAAFVGAGVQSSSPPRLTEGELRAFVQRLPVEKWMCCESRKSLGARELRERLRRRRVEPSGVLERRELVEALEASPHENLCSICHDELEDEVELRLLPCCHYFHVHCVDRWLCDPSRAPSCPLCSTQLDVSGVRRDKTRVPHLVPRHGLVGLLRRAWR